MDPELLIEESAFNFIKRNPKLLIDTLTSYMKRLFSNILNKTKISPEKGDDFSRFFLEASTAEKTRVIKEIMKEATAEQEAILRKYSESKLIGV